MSVTVGIQQYTYFGGIRRCKCFSRDKALKVLLLGYGAVSDMVGIRHHKCFSGDMAL